MRRGFVQQRHALQKVASMAQIHQNFNNICQKESERLWLDWVWKNSMTWVLGGFWFCKQVLSIFPSCSRPAKFIENAIHYMKCASPHLSWLFWKTTWASSANLGIQKHGLLKGAVSISMVQMMIVSINWKLNCWFLPFLWLNHCLDSGSMASLYLKYNMTCHRTAEARPIHGNQQIPRPFNNSQVNDLASVWAIQHSSLGKPRRFAPIFSQGSRTPVPIGASGRVEQDILPCNNVEQQNWGCSMDKKNTKNLYKTNHKKIGDAPCTMLVGDTTLWFQGISVESY